MSFVCQYLWGHYLYQQEYSCRKVRICLTTGISFHSIQYRLPENGRYFITNAKSSKKKGAQTLFNMHVAFVKAECHFNNTHDPTVIKNDTEFPFISLFTYQFRIGKIWEFPTNFLLLEINISFTILIHC